MSIFMSYCNVRSQMGIPSQHAFTSHIEIFYLNLHGGNKTTFIFLTCMYLHLIFLS